MVKLLISSQNRIISSSYIHLFLEPVDYAQVYDENIMTFIVESFYVPKVM